jgi:DNA-binding winged helix-turn-helix (wHTH) protein
MSANPQPAKPAVFRFGEFTFDSESRLLLHRGAERHLSPKAQQLLHLLLEAQPRALSRQQLYDALWPSTFVCETNLASVVREVRCALGDDARASQYIRTMHRFGYAFRGDVTSPASLEFAAATLRCEGQSHQLCEGDNVVGRAPEGRIVIAEPTISRQHAIITVHRDAFFIKDLHSTNGTYVNGQRIGPTPIAIRPNARIEFGATVASLSLRTFSSTLRLRLNMHERKRPHPSG